MPGPVTGRPRRPLSIKASTASCSIRFSLRTIISGAPKSNSLFRRLLRLITRRYKSFKSEVAKRPPSNCTMGRSSGGITGKTSIIIHTGSLPDKRKASTTSNRLIARLLRCPVVVATSSLSSADMLSKSISLSRACIASAPMPASKLSP